MGVLLDRLHHLSFRDLHSNREPVAKSLIGALQRETTSHSRETPWGQVRSQGVLRRRMNRRSWGRHGLHGVVAPDSARADAAARQNVAAYVLDALIAAKSLF